MSYPNKEDEQRARKNRWAPGGSIMIHGLPNTPKHPARLLCVERLDRRLHRLSNSDMVEVWMRTQDNIPIDIYPVDDPAHRVETTIHRPTWSTPA